MFRSYLDSSRALSASFSDAGTASDEMRSQRIHAADPDSAYLGRANRVLSGCIFTLIFSSALLSASQETPLQQRTQSKVSQSGNALAAEDSVQSQPVRKRPCSRGLSAKSGDGSAGGGAVPPSTDKYATSLGGAVRLACADPRCSNVPSIKIMVPAGTCQES